MISEGGHFLPRADLDRLVDVLRDDGRALIGPRVRDGALMLDEIESVADLPVGVGLVNEPGSARLVQRDDTRVFDQPPGPSSWKRWTFPPRVEQTVWTDNDPANGTGRSAKSPPRHVQKTAFLGVRACEIEALRVQDRVLMDGPVIDRDYAARRRENLIVAVECAVAGGTCFCTSMGTGPEVRDGFDLALSELDEGFVVRVGSPRGQSVVDALALPAATDFQAEDARTSVSRVREQIKPIDPTFTTDGLPERLVAAAESPRWAEIAERCLACTNCTLVCPTCFCTSISQRSDLDGQQASAERSWDFMLHPGLRTRRGRQLPAPDRGSLPPMADPQVRDVDDSIRLVRMRWLRTMHQLVSSRY